MEHKLDVAAAPGTLLCVVARVLAATVTVVTGHCREGGDLSACFALVLRSGGGAAKALLPARVPPCLPILPPIPVLGPLRPHTLLSPAPLCLTFTVSLVLGELEARAAFTGNAPLGSLPANVGTAMVLVHAVHSF